MNYKNIHLNQFATATDLPNLIVLIGFTPSQVSGLEESKLLSVSFPTKLNSFSMGPELLMEISQSISDKKEYYWCTMEEYQFYISEGFSKFFHTTFIYNNLYNRQFPLCYEIEKKEKLITIFAKDDENIPEEEAESFDFITKFYSSIDEHGDYYVTYSSSEEIQEQWVPYFEKATTVIPSAPDGQEEVILEISEDESQFLELSTKIINQTLKGEFVLAYREDIDSFTNNYRERILLLNELSLDCKLYISLKVLEEKFFDETPYSQILNKYWGHAAFRTLPMYKDPSKSNELMNISQSQIINDLVTNALEAHENKPFRDIFITSPTGAGKSVMFQIPSLYLFEKAQLLTIVISPLIGLMKDQVSNLRAKGINSVATINSDITPIEKSQISEQISAGKISTLYISPETLLSRSDIKMLIGDRKIGLFIVDEAHIVTTWGKAFRADYWYLGTYLQKLRKEMKFPIATFTATAIYGGEEDMYKETRDSLTLLNPITYLGKVRRDEIKMGINSKSDDFRGDEYLRTKLVITAERTKRFIRSGEKTLIYFPTISSILKFKVFVEENYPRTADKLTVYYGRLRKEEKESNASKFKSGESPVMLATKAFGMGIDIPDIKNVYHFAPTGNVCDYVQEIGRAARDLPEGNAHFDFLSNDFSHIRRLHGMSTIRKHQLQLVAQKILSVYKEKRKRSRNLLVSAEDFRYIFEQESNSDHEGDIDGKLKTALLLLEKDFTLRMGYSPFVARPRGIFSKEYFRVKKEGEKYLQLKKHAAYASKVKDISDSATYTAIYELNLKKIWEKDYRNMSFAQFKYFFHSRDSSIDLPFLEYLDPVMEVRLTSHLKKQLLIPKTTEVLNKLEVFLRNKAMEKTYFHTEELAAYLSKSLKKDKFISEGIAQIVLQSMQRYGQISGNMNANNIARHHESRGYRILSGYQDFLNFISSSLDQHLNNNALEWDESKNEGSLYLPKRTTSRSNETASILFGVLEALNILNYQIIGGNTPEIYIRINSVLELERLVKHPEKYRNRILESVHFRHRLSVAMLTYIFKNKMQSEEFWNTIEEYFLGRIPEEVIHATERPGVIEDVINT